MADQASNDAEALYAKGKAHAAKGNYPAAYDLFKQAWQRRQAYDTACNLGHTALLLGKNVEGTEHLTYCVANYPSGETQRSVLG